jgi:hypothetical protein
VPQGRTRAAIGAACVERRLSQDGDGDEGEVKYSTVGNNDFGTMKNGVISGGTVFNQSTTFQIQPPGLPQM